jgi:AcrR family transcriptional regulator
MFPHVTVGASPGGIATTPYRTQASGILWIRSRGIPRKGVDTNERSFYYRAMKLGTSGKGEQTRQAILSHALRLATKVGIEGLTIGRLAKDLQMSKSGLIAHFQTKEALQVQVLETGAHRFVEDVLRPALKAPRGEPRLRALFEGFLAWEASPSLPGGCPLIAASTELDDRPGPARNYLVQARRDLFDLLAGTVRSGIDEGQFRPDVDPEQFAYEFWGAMLAYHHASRLMRDPRALARAEAAFEALVRAARSQPANSTRVSRGR